MVPSAQQPKAKPDTNRFVEIARKRLMKTDDGYLNS